MPTDLPNLTTEFVSRYNQQQRELQALRQSPTTPPEPEIGELQRQLAVIRQQQIDQRGMLEAEVATLRSELADSKNALLAAEKKARLAAEDLAQIDPQLRAVFSDGNGNLLDPANTRLLKIDTSTGKEVRVKLKLENGPEVPMTLAIASDQPWLRSETATIDLRGGESTDCILKVDPSGETEYANLLFSWDGAQETHRRSVLIQRIIPPPPVPPGWPLRLIVTLAVALFVLPIIGWFVEKTALFLFLGASAALVTVGFSITKRLRL